MRSRLLCPQNRTFWLSCAAPRPCAAGLLHWECPPALFGVLRTPLAAAPSPRQRNRRRRSNQNNNLEKRSETERNNTRKHQETKAQVDSPNQHRAGQGVIESPG